MKPRKIISGGQTGVDQAALSVALESGIECGGWCPPGRVCESGKIPVQFPLTETPYDRSEKAGDIPRSLRTEWNVRDADATLILKSGSIPSDQGTEWTIQCIASYRKLSLIVDLDDESASQKIAGWLRVNKIQVLNVAGPSENSVSGIYAKTFKTLMKALHWV